MDWILKRKRSSRGINIFFSTKHGQEDYQGHTEVDKILLVSHVAPVLKSLTPEQVFYLLGCFFWVKSPWELLGLSSDKIYIGKTRF